MYHHNYGSFTIVLAWTKDVLAQDLVPNLAEKCGMILPLDMQNFTIWGVGGGVVLVWIGMDKINGVSFDQIFGASKGWAGNDVTTFVIEKQYTTIQTYNPHNLRFIAHVNLIKILFPREE